MMKGGQGSPEKQRGSATQDSIVVQGSNDSLIISKHESAHKINKEIQMYNARQLSGTYKFQKKSKESKKFNPANYETPASLL